jgi:anaerobic selenocysteine-containing dehydrogenase
MGEWRTRVRGAPAFNGEQPAACLAEEIATPGEGQIRGMITVAGNPCLSAPNQAALDSAFESLEFYLAVDFYINETTRHADIILPPTWSLEHDAYEVLFHGFAVQNTARYSPVVVAAGEDQRHDWEILSELALRIAERKQQSALRRGCLRAIRWAGLVPGPRRYLDWMLRLGPYGDGFRPWRGGLRLRDLEANPSGLDLGPLVSCLEDVLPERDTRIDVAPSCVVEELARLARELATAEAESHPEDAKGGASLLLIGRRDIRTNNSWLHNVPVSTKGKERCTLQMNPGDAQQRDLSQGQRVRICSRVGEVEAPLELTDDLMPGVVSLPHGWGHRGEGLCLTVAQQHPGVNANVLTDDQLLEPVVGNAVLNGVPVEVSASDGKL